MTISNLRPLFNNFTMEVEDDDGKSRTVVDEETRAIFATRIVGVQIYDRLDQAGRLVAAFMIDLRKNAQIPTGEAPKCLEECPEAHDLLKGRVSLRERDGGWKQYKVVDADGKIVGARLYHVRWNPDGEKAYGQGLPAKPNGNVEERMRIWTSNLELVVRNPGMNRFENRRDPRGRQHARMYMRGVSFVETTSAQDERGMAIKETIADQLVLWVPPDPRGVNREAGTIGFDPYDPPFVAVLESGFVDKMRRLWSEQEEAERALRTSYYCLPMSGAGESEEDESDESDGEPVVAQSRTEVIAQEREAKRAAKAAAGDTGGEEPKRGRKPRSKRDPNANKRRNEKAVEAEAASEAKEPVEEQSAPAAS